MALCHGGGYAEYCRVNENHCLPVPAKRNPMLSGVLVWALVHLIANGDLASILLFGLFGAFSVIDIISVNRRSPANSLARQPLVRDFMVLTIGFAAFWTVRYFHAPLFGVPAVL